VAEWPVEVVERPSEIPVKLHEPIAPGETTYAALVRLDGRRTYLFVCPRCAEAGHCLEHRSIVRDGKLTMTPSLVCGCGGHHWMTDGVLREV
jgi:hypothetical protein